MNFDLRLFSFVFVFSYVLKQTLECSDIHLLNYCSNNFSIFAFTEDIGKVGPMKKPFSCVRLDWVYKYSLSCDAEVEKCWLFANELVLDDLVLDDGKSSNLETTDLKKQNICLNLIYPCDWLIHSL